ncbi:MAG: hypothetical protein U0W24_12615 [Bacteroidales bacterium]
MPQKAKMTSEQIKISIDKDELQLQFWDKLAHYKLVLLFFFISVLYLVNEYIFGSSMKDLGFKTLVSIPFLVLGFYFYKIQKSELKFQSVIRNLPNDELKFIIEEVMIELEWEIEYVDKNVFVATTSPGPFSVRFGERITILLDKEKIYVNSICDPHRKSSISSNGRNRKNMLTLIEKIEKNQVARTV